MNPVPILRFAKNGDRFHDGCVAAGASCLPASARMSAAPSASNCAPQEDRRPVRSERHPDHPAGRVPSRPRWRIGPARVAASPAWPASGPGSLRRRASSSPARSSSARAVILDRPAPHASTRTSTTPRCSGPRTWPRQVRDQHARRPPCRSTATRTRSSRSATPHGHAVARSSNLTQDTARRHLPPRGRRPGDPHPEDPRCAGRRTTSGSWRSTPRGRRTARSRSTSSPASTASRRPRRPCATSCAGGCRCWWHWSGRSPGSSSAARCGPSRRCGPRSRRSRPRTWAGACRCPGRDDEIGRLATTMNDMLDRLQHSAERERRFVADASHELQSPLASSLADLEVALAHPESTEWEATARAVVADNERMTRLVGDLLFLAQSDNNGASPGAGAPWSTSTTSCARRSPGCGRRRGSSSTCPGVSPAEVRGDAGPAGPGRPQPPRERQPLRPHGHHGRPCRPTAPAVPS